MIKRILISLSIILSVLVPALTVVTPSLAYADTKSQVCQGLGVAGANCSDQNGAASGVNSLISTIVSILSMIVGVAAVIMLIIAGLKYATAGGDSNAIESAKNSIIYALVGLIVAALAQVLVHWVLAVTK